MGNDFIDPIQRLIDWQMRSIAGAWGQLPPGNFCGEPNTMEELFAEALDEKYADITQYDRRLMKYLMAGFSQEEIGELFGIAPRWVRKRVRKLRELLG